MKILNVSTVDYCGCGINLTNAINKHTRHRARNLSLKTHRFGYQTDIVTSNKRIIRKWLEWADVISAWVTFDACMGMLPRDKILVLHHIGGHYYGAPEVRHEEAKRKGTYQVVAGAYMTRWGLPWLPFAVPVDEYAKYAKPIQGVVAQTASNPLRRGSVGKILSDVEIIANVSHEECLRRRGKASIAIGSYRGYGVGDVEAWAMYQPVISYPMSTEDEEAELEQIGYLPYYKATLEELPDVLEMFLSNPSLCKEWAERGYEFAGKFHDVPVVAEKFVKFLEEKI